MIKLFKKYVIIAIISTPIILLSATDISYVIGSSQGILQIINPAGDTEWEWQSSYSGEIRYLDYKHNGNIWFVEAVDNENWSRFAIIGKDGNIIWEKRLPGHIHDALPATDGTIYFGSTIQGGRLGRITPQGDEIWALDGLDGMHYSGFINLSSNYYYGDYEDYNGSARDEFNGVLSTYRLDWPYGCCSGYGSRDYDIEYWNMKKDTTIIAWESGHWDGQITITIDGKNHITTEDISDFGQIVDIDWITSDKFLIVDEVQNDIAIYDTTITENWRYSFSSITPLQAERIINDIDDSSNPGKITSLTLKEIDGTTARLAFISPGDDGYSGDRVSGYEIRYSSNSLTESNWSDASIVPVTPFVKNPGEAATLYVFDLPQGASNIGIRSYDDNGNYSEISNIIQVNIANQTLNTKWNGLRKISDEQGNKFNPRITKDNENNLHVVWTSHQEGQHQINYKKQQDGEWLSSEVVYTGNNPVWTPDITIDEENIAHIVWIEQDGTSTLIYYSKSTMGGWSSTEKVPQASFHTFQPKIITNNGITYIASYSDNWEESWPGNSEIYVTDNSDGSWNSPVPVSYSSTRSDIKNIIKPKLLAINDTIYVTWLERIGHQQKAYMALNYRTETTSWSFPQTLESIEINRVDQNQYDIGKIGDTLVAASTNQGELNLSFIKKNDLVKSINKPDYGDIANYRNFDMDACNGKAGIVFSGIIGNDIYTPVKIIYNEYYKGQWSEDTVLTESAGYSDYPSVTISESSKHVVWQERDNENIEIFYADQGDIIRTDTTYISGGTITQNTTWTKANSPYLISDGVSIENGATLTIEPGVDIFFQSETNIKVAGGFIKANGIESDSITFSSNSVANNRLKWKIDIYSSGYQNYFQYCSFSNSSLRALGTLVDADSNVVVDHCKFKNNALAIDGNICSAIIKNSEFISNYEAIRIPIDISPAITRCVFRNNHLGLNIYDVATPLIQECSFINNEDPISITNQARPIFHYNNLDFSFQLESSEDIDCRYNYWGPTATSEMNSGDNPKNISTIYDYFDDANLGKVDYFYWLDAPWPDGQPVNLTDSIYIPDDYSTIQTGIDSAEAGQTIIVREGTYIEQINIDKPIILIGEAGPENTILSGNSEMSICEINDIGTADTVKINSFSFIDGYSEGSVSASAARNNGEGPVLLTNCIFSNNDYNTDEWGGTIASTSSNMKISSCVFKDNTNKGGGILVAAAFNFIELYNVLGYNNQGVLFSVENGGLDYTGTLTLFYSTFKDNQLLGSPLFSAGSNINLNIKNSIIWESSIFGGDYDVNVTFSNLRNQINGEGNISIDPLLTEDFHLTDISPCIGEGTAIDGLDYDLAGNPRPNPSGSNPDMGAYESPRPAPLDTLKYTYIPDHYSTIQAGIEAAEEGDTIIVKPGTYQENIDFLGKNIVLGSLMLTRKDTSYISQTIIDGNKNGSVVTFANGENKTTRLIGLNIQNGNGTDPDGSGYTRGGGIYCTNWSSPTINNCIIKNNQALNGGGVDVSYSFAVLKNCIIENNTAGGISSPHGGGINIAGGDGTKIINCTVRSNDIEGEYSAGINISSSEVTIKNTIVERNNGVGITFHLCGSSIINSTIVSNKNSGIWHNMDTLNIFNSIIYDNGLNDIILGDDGSDNNTDPHVNFAYTDIDGGEEGLEVEQNGSYSWIIGNMDKNPQFINSANNNYRLLDSSPCIGAGTDSTKFNDNWYFASSTDIDGNIRPDPPGSQPDIGAYENSRSTPLDTSKYVFIPDDYSTIQHGINASEEGDTIIVQPGTYQENIDFLGKNITLASKMLLNADTSYIRATIIDGVDSGNIVNITSGEDTTAILKGFKIINGDNGVNIRNSQPKIQNCIISGNNQHGIVISECDGIYPEISYCEISNQENANGIHVEGDSRINNCSIHQNGKGIKINDNAYCLIKNNKVFDNKEDGVQTSYEDCSKAVIIENNTIYNNYRSGVEFPADGIFIVNYNNIYGNLYEWDLNNQGPSNIDARFNYWGDKGTNEMNRGNNPRDISNINDFFDDTTRGEVDYIPWLDAPWPEGEPVGSDTTYISGGTITQDSTWLKEESPYLIKGEILFGNNATLAINPGCKIIFASTDARINTRFGQIIAIGSESDSIYFTSNLDNHDYGLDLNSEQNDTIKYCKFTKFQCEDVLGLGTDPIISHCVFENNHAYAIDNNLSSGSILYSNFINNGRGISIDGGSPQIQYNVFKYNEYTNIGFSPNTMENPNISYNNFYNGEFRLESTDNINAQYNYWGSTATSEMNAGNNPKNISTIYDYYDDANLGKVEYSYWLDAPWPKGEPVDLSDYIYIPDDYTTIQTGIDSAETGQTIIVREGTYIEQLYIDKPIILIGESGPDKTILSGNSENSICEISELSRMDTVRIDGFSFIDGFSEDDVASAINNMENMLIVSNCIFNNNRHNNSDNANSGTITTSNSIEINNCIFKDNIASNNNAIILRELSSQDLVLKNVLAVNNQGVLIHTNCGTSGENTKIINCTFYNNSDYNSYAGFFFNHADSDQNYLNIVNTILWDSGEINLEGNAPELSVTYSNLQNKISGQGNISTDPLLTKDYHLSDISPCLGTGTPIEGLDYDLAGNPRPNPEGSNPDMGAYESPRSAPLDTLKYTYIPDHYSTIQAGIEAAEEGDTIIVKPGTYKENIDFLGKNIVLGSKTLLTGDTSFVSRTIIDGGENGAVVKFSKGEDSTAILCGLEITNSGSQNVGTDNEKFDSGIYIMNSSPTILKNTICNNHIGIYKQDEYNITNRTLIKENKIVNNLQIGIKINGGASNINIIDNYINNNGNFDNEYDCGINIDGANNILTKNNIISRNPMGLRIYAGSDNIHIQNNEIKNNLYGITLGDVHVYTIHNNIYENHKYNVFCSNESDNYDYQFPENYWGESTTSEMNTGGNPKNISTIYDGFDDPDLPKVDYIPWLDKAWPEGEPVDVSEYIYIPDDYSTIQIGIDSAEAGQTIIVREGTYIEQINIDKPIILIGEAGPDKTILSGNSENSICEIKELSRMDTVKIDGFSFIEGFSEDDVASAINNMENMLIVSNCIFNNNRHNNSDNASSGTITSNSIEINNCIFKDNIASNGNAIILRGRSSQDLVLKNILAVNNQGVLIHTNCGTLGENTKIINCTFYNNSDYNTNVGFVFNHDDSYQNYLNIVNTILWDSGEIYLEGNAPELSVTYSNLQNEISGQGNISTDPLLTEDYHLSDISPCLGAGTPIEGLDYDLAGNTRPNPAGSNPDMGAYESPLANAGDVARPSVTMKKVTNITRSSATLNGSVNPHGLSTTVEFEYGKTFDYGNTVAYENNPIDGDAYQDVSVNIDNLEEDTEYHYTLVANNDRGTTNNGDYTFHTISTSTPPSISDVVASPAEPSVYEDIQITANIDGPNDLTEAQIIYWEGGSENSYSQNMNSDDGHVYRGSIPSNHITPKGIVFTVSATDIYDNVAYSDTISPELLFNSLNSGSQFSQYESGLPGQEWCLITVPSQIEQNSIEDIFYDDLGGLDSTKWQIFYYYNEQDRFVNSNFYIQPGRGYWLYHRLDENVKITTGGGKSSNLTNTNLEIQPGWNLIGSPFIFPVTVDFNQTKFYGPLYYKTGESKGWSTVQSELQPWAGYAIYNKTAIVQTIKLDPLENSNLQKNNTSVADGWKVQIDVSTTNFKDEYNYIGCLEGAEESKDYYDNPEPPNIGKYISLYASSDKKTGRKFSASFHPLQSEQSIWQLFLDSEGIVGKVELKFIKQGKVPRNKHLKMICLSNGDNWNLNKLSKASFDLLSDEFDYKFKIIYGSKHYVDQKYNEFLVDLPREYKLKQNYPNPFNPITTISYSLPEPAFVNLTIYDLLGRKIKTLVNKYQIINNYEIKWNGIDSNSNRVSSGLYLYKLTAKSGQKIITKTNKMIFMQ